ncbi:LSM8 homolog, U6 small nuclear RNA associated isoform X1 [Falco biarmicus]|nr:LSM8 homolog, U6 small nuclear RNA associated isoform X1 [Falco cherrug]XP_037245454.1 LSM8 homolog, U6 small nuclear RNA associated isoform X1 [Falco rusticolus]XP_055663370.1 LSM8 homolog, U6 small nuclear RNA associated isoform X1 [Falco peregrinus]XP_056195455.1 LSM8 homolog, U6 small nuclear RNA associated isoform X1 [Falco biarmicus]
MLLTTMVLFLMKKKKNTGRLFWLLLPLKTFRSVNGSVSDMSKYFLNELSGTVAVITSDGRMIVGTLKGFDQTINLILDESHERVFSSSQGVEQVVLGLYIVRGDNVAVIGEIDEETDSALDLGNIRAEPLNSVVH